MKIFLKRKLLIVALAPALGMPFAASSIAQTTGTQGTAADRSPSQSQQQQSTQREQSKQEQQATKIRDMRASKILGADVKNAKGENLGDVQDLIVNADDGQVDFAIVAFGGVLGFGEKLFAYPMDRFQAGTADEELVLNASEEEMKNAPGFDRSNWPTWGTGGYRGEVEKHFGQTAQTGGNLVRVSEMLNTKVVDKAGKNVGEIEDVVVSITDGKVQYVALEPDRELNMGDRLAILPMNAIRATGEQTFERKQQAQQTPPAEPRQPGQPPQATVQTERQQQAQRRDQDLQLVLNVEPQELQKARTIEQGKWPDLNDQAFQREMDSYVASFPSGAQAGTSAGATGTQGQTGASTGATGTQGQTGTGSTESGRMQSDQPSQTLPAQEGTQQRQPESTGQSK